MNGLYGDVIMDHYDNPRNKGSLEQPEASYEDENPLCGDRLRMEMIFDPPLSQESSQDERRIAEVRFSGVGCAISQASASILTEAISGRTVRDALALGKDDLLDELGIPLSPSRLKCALLALKVCKAALYGLGSAAML